LSVKVVSAFGANERN